MNADLPNRLLPSEPGQLDVDTLECLWELFAAIANIWGTKEGSANLNSPLAYRSQWLEFIDAKTLHRPSYVTEYRTGVETLRELHQRHGAGVWNELMFGPSRQAALTTKVGHLRHYVAEEFIRVWLVAGGFKAYGAGNYNGFVSGSRFATAPPYRFVQ